MSNSNKITQLQIRVTAGEKLAIQKAAEQANLNMSSYVLAKLLPPRSREFQAMLDRLVNSDDPSFILSEINTLLTRLKGNEITDVVSVTLPADLSEYLSNYVAAMVEYVCNQHHTKKPAWVKSVKPLKQPFFGSTINNLRLYLLTCSPAAFRRRNIFIDTTIGGQA